MNTSFNGGNQPPQSSCCLLIIGAVVGTMIGGSLFPIAGNILGAFAGVWLVNTLAAANSPKTSSDSRPGSNNSFRPRMTREEFVRNLVGALSRLAAADGNISNAEIQLIGAYIAELFPDISTETVKESFKQALDRRSGISFAGCCHKMRIFIGRDYNKAFTVMELFCELAFCDGELSAGEQQLLLQAEQVFELSGFTQIFMARKKYRKSGAASSRNDEECLRILGC
jgi:tellurite resistance protein